MGMSGGLTSQQEPELSGARSTRRSGNEPRLGGDRALDWNLWEALLNDSAPAQLRVELIPEDQRDGFVSALLEALPPGATYTRPLERGEVWRGQFTPTQRMGAIRLLGALRDRRAARPLAEHLDDPSNHVRIAIIMALGWIGGPIAVEALAKVLANHPHEPSRTEAARWLGWIRDRAACEALAEALGDPSTTVRVATAKSLALLDDPRAFGPLVDAFWQLKGIDRDHILEQLHRFDPARTVRMLIQARGSEDSARYDIASRALHRLGTPEASAALEPYDHRAAGNFDDL